MNQCRNTTRYAACYLQREDKRSDGYGSCGSAFTQAQPPGSILDRGRCMGSNGAGADAVLYWANSTDHDRRPAAAGRVGAPAARSGAAAGSADCSTVFNPTGGTQNR